MPKVLLVEDYPVLRENLQEQLQVAHFQVRAAEDGAKALALLAEFHPDVIICDILMPHLDGLAFLEAVKQHPRYRSIPVLFLTAKVSPEERLEGLRRGAIDYITKPFSSQELLLKVNNIIDQQAELVRHRLQQQMAQEESDLHFVRQVNECLEQAFGDAAFGLTQLAEAMSMSPSALQRQLRLYCQRSFSQLLREYRLLKADTYLVRTDRNLQWIAARCGFSSLSSFSHCFKEERGLSPLQFRQTNRASY